MSMKEGFTKEALLLEDKEWKKLIEMNKGLMSNNLELWLQSWEHFEATLLIHDINLSLVRYGYYTGYFGL